MNKQEKIETFCTELEYIKDADIKKFTEEMIARLPDYFFEVGASSSGRYHPKYALGEGGLVRHTISAVRIALELFRRNIYGKLLCCILARSGNKHNTVYSL